MTTGVRVAFSRRPARSRNRRKCVATWTKARSYASSCMTIRFAHRPGESIRTPPRAPALGRTGGAGEHALLAHVVGAAEQRRLRALDDPVDVPGGTPRHIDQTRAIRHEATDLHEVRVLVKGAAAATAPRAESDARAGRGLWRWARWSARFTPGSYPSASPRWLRYHASPESQGQDTLL